MAVLAACGRKPPSPAASGPGRTAVAVAASGYIAPPELQSVQIGRGSLQLAGIAAPSARVRLATPTGQAVYAAADETGAWRVAISASGEPRLFGLSMSDDGRVVQAKGYLFIAPDGRAARLRAGGGSEAVARPSVALAASAFDYDQQAATLSGWAAPAETVSLRVDGVQRGQAGADRKGRFVLPLNQPLAAGAHEFELDGARGGVSFTLGVAGPAPLVGVAFRAAREGLGWRVEWLTPGGGEQTTLVFDPMQAAP